MFSLSKNFHRESELLSLHVEREHSKHDSELLCSVCGKSFTTNATLKSHIQNNQVEKKTVVCDGCGKSFEDKKSLGKHKRQVHTNEKDRKYVCEVCSKRFVLKNQLQSHIMNVHIRTRP